MVRNFPTDPDSNPNFAALHAGLFLLLLLWVYKLASMALLRLSSPCGKHQCKMPVVERQLTFQTTFFSAETPEAPCPTCVDSDRGGRVDEDSMLLIFIPRFSG